MAPAGGYWRGRPRTSRIRRVLVATTAAVLVASMGRWASADGEHRVVPADPPDGGMQMRTSTSYGYSDSLIQDSDSRHRLGIKLEARFGFSKATVGARIDGWYDRHVGLTGGTDQAWVGEPRLFARSGWRLGAHLSVGGQVMLRFPGKDAPSIAVDAASVDAIGAATVRWGEFSIGFNVGARIDNSIDAAPRAERLSPADRLGLGISDADALLLRVGVKHPWRSGGVFAEVSVDRLLGARASDGSLSPRRLATGMWWPLAEHWSGQVVVEVNGATMPDGASDAPLVALEPRLTLGGALVYRFGTTSHQPTALIGREAPRPPPPPVRVPRARHLRGRVMTSAGEPIARATVKLHVGAGDQVAFTDALGRFEFEMVPAGKGASLTVRLSGYGDVTVPLDPEGSAIEIAPIVLQADLPAGQLRGFVKSFRGIGLSATLRVDPSGAEVSTNKDGSFEIELEPGSYHVSITAPGYGGQLRAVEIERDGVTILNVDLKLDGRR